MAPHCPVTKTWPDEHEKNRSVEKLLRKDTCRKGEGLSEGLSKEHGGLLCALSPGLLLPGPGSAAAVNVH